MPEEARVKAQTQITLDATQIQAIIPHRPPFLLIDRIIELEPGKRIVGLKDVSLTSDDFLRGHFPDYAVMPGVLIVEALAQTGAVLVMHDRANAGKLPFFARIDNCRFRQQVRPGDSLRLEVEVTSFRAPVGKARGRALVGNRLACEADLTFALGTAEFDQGQAQGQR
jgi:3-hydroxyacyl-[acyl-carrier-protein] dehydratase